MVAELHGGSARTTQVETYVDDAIGTGGRDMEMISVNS